MSPNRAQLLVPAPLVGLDSNIQSQVLDQAQALKVGERYDRHPPLSLKVALRGSNAMSVEQSQHGVQYERNKLIPVKCIFTMCSSCANPFFFIYAMHCTVFV